MYLSLVFQTSKSVTNITVKICSFVLMEYGCAGSELLVCIKEQREYESHPFPPPTWRGLLGFLEIGRWRKLEIF